MERPDGVLVSAGEFIAVAEQLGLSRLIDRRTLAARLGVAPQRRKGKGRQSRQHQLRGQNDGDEQRGIEEVARKRRGLPSVAKVLQRPRRAQVKARGVFAGVEGCPHRIGQRQYPQQRQQPGRQSIEPGVAVNNGRCVVHL